MMTVPARSALLAIMGVTLCAVSSPTALAAQKSPAGRATGSTAQSQEWARLETLLSGIHGVSTASPANLVSSKYTSGALMGNGDIGVVAGDPLPSQQTFWFGKSDFWGSHWNTRHNSTEVSILSLGHLTLSSPAKASEPETVYRVDQDILHARVDSTLKLGEATVHLSSWTAENENLFLTEVKADGGASVPLTLTLAMPAPDPEAHTVFPGAAGIRDGALWATRENNLTGEADYKARAAIAVRLLGAKLIDPTTATNSASASFVLKPGASVWIITSFESDARMNPNGPSAATLADHALEQAAPITPARVSTLEREHLDWWKQFWLRSFIEVHDKVLEDYYYGALYVLGTSSRPGKLPPSLWSNFLTTDNAGWGGRYFMNYNEEAPFYGVFSSNRPELAEPYNRMVLAQIPWQKNRTAAAGYKGVAFQRTFSPFTVIADPPAPVPVAAEKNWKKLPADQKSNGTFSLLPTIQYYEYTQDREFLRTKLYPAMKEFDAFWRDFAVRDTTGKQWIFEHTSAHEGGDDLNASLDIGFARRVARELIETSKVLGVDAEMRPIWQSFLDQLTPYPSGTVNGKTVYYIAESIKNNIKNQGPFEPGDQPINLEGPVYPGENLSIGGDPRQLEIARNSMEEMHSWSVTKGGNSYNGFCKIFPIAARIGWPSDDLVAKFKAAIQYQWRPSNLTVFQGGGGIETAGSIEALNSMLLQHEDGVMRLFPDWPATMDASFTRLRAKGAFLVSSQQRNGKVTAIDLTSEKGGPLTIQSPWGNAAVTLSGASSPLQPDASGRISLKTMAGKSYHLSAQ
ncbi:glycosyl hydrolase family 95 catalytic domain-containing protein [Edaphobacter aggregans]|uniref:glycosyl hydrolase family 95 catalytic domain-containing protein n=1 Tax=Edaphobacter aggregans TaxID=570835 RepID=UPI000554A3AC|nr:hypothetical protein [Edaphobacter aggregans]